MAAERITTMLFPDGKQKTLTLSYDDGVIQDRRLIELMRRYHVRGTFNLNTGLLGEKRSLTANEKVVDLSIIEKSEIAELYKGQEVATHASHHSALTEMGAAAADEVLEDRKELEAIVPYMVKGHAYPFGFYDEAVVTMLKSIGICYARTVVSTGDFSFPADFLKWHPTCHHDDPRLMELARKFCEEEDVFGRPQLFYLWGHAYEFDIHDNWERIEAFLEYVSGFQDTVWMATNGEIADYRKAYGELLYSADGKRVYNPTAVTIWLRCRGKTYAVAPGKTESLI